MKKEQRKPKLQNQKSGAVLSAVDALVSGKRTEEYRVNWKASNGTTGQGKWNENKSLIESWVEWGNRECKNVVHHLESR